jgi:hypothetical protein
MCMPGAGSAFFGLRQVHSPTISDMQGVRHEVNPYETFLHVKCRAVNEWCYLLLVVPADAEKLP